MGKHLAAYKKTKFEKTHKIRYMFGKGMHHNIWEYVQDRFNVRIIEYYGTVSNIHLGSVAKSCLKSMTIFFSTVNINFHRGAAGYLPKLLPPIIHPYHIVRILWHDAKPIRTQGGVCDRVGNCI